MQNLSLSRALAAALISISPCLQPCGLWAAQAVVRPVVVRFGPAGFSGALQSPSLQMTGSQLSFSGNLTPGLSPSVLPVGVAPTPTLLAPSALSLNAPVSVALTASVVAPLSASAQLETGRSLLESPVAAGSEASVSRSSWDAFWSFGRRASAADATPAKESPREALAPSTVQTKALSSAQTRTLPATPALGVAAVGVSAPFAWFAQLAAAAAPYAWIGGFVLSAYALVRGAKSAAGKVADWAKVGPAVKEAAQKVSMLAALAATVSVPRALPHLFDASKPYMSGAAVLAATYGLNCLLNLAVDKTSAAFEWSVKTTRVVRASASGALWALGLGTGLEAAGYSTLALATTAWGAVQPYTGSGLSVFGAVFASRYASRLVTWSKSKGWIDPAHEGLWRRLAYVVVWGSAAVVGLHTAGVSATALLATAGIGAVFATLAAKKVIGNLMRGVMLLLNSPIQQGERIKIDGEPYTVEDMTLQNVLLKPEVGEVTSITYTELAGKVIIVGREYKTKKDLRAPARFGLKDFFTLAKQKTAEIDMKAAAVWMGLGLGLTFVMPALTAWIGIGVALPYLQAAAIAVASRTTERWLTGFINGLAERNGWNRQLTMVIRLGARAVTYGASFWIGLGVLGLSWGKLMATMGASSMVFGWATADVFQSIIDGTKNLWTNSRNFGKIVKVGKHQGLFVDMNLHHIILATGPDSHILVPQSMMDFFTVMGTPETGDPYGQSTYKTPQSPIASN